MPDARRLVDVLVVSLGSTTGLRTADEDFASMLRAAGTTVELAFAQPPRQVRTLMLTDLAWALAARRAAAQALAQVQPGAIVYSTTTAALLWPAPGAIRFDAPAAGNRPGRHGLWQRPLERRRLLASPLLLPLSSGGLAEAGLPPAAAGRALVLALPVEPSGPPAPERDIAAIAYAANPVKKGLDRVLGAWSALQETERLGEGSELVVAGASEAELSTAGISLRGRSGVRSAGRLPGQEYRSLLRRSRVFVCAPRREDYGQAQMEALADGCLLVTTPAPGPYAALPIARELDERLVGEDLAQALAAGLSHPDRAGYALRAQRALRPFATSELQRRVAEELLPRLGVAPAA
jgi:hypothetical protein